MHQLTAKEIKAISGITYPMRMLNFGQIIADIISNTNSAIESGTPVNAVNASVVFAVSVNPTADETFVIGAKTYKFVAAATVIGDIEIGVDLPATKVAIVAAINGTDGLNTAHTLVTAANFAANNCAITAKTAGTAGNNIAVSATMANGSFATAKLANGVDGSIGTVDTILLDESYVYFAVADNTVSGKNWRRISLGSAY